MNTYLQLSPFYTLIHHAPFLRIKGNNGPKSTFHKPRQAQHSPLLFLGPYKRTQTAVLLFYLGGAAVGEMRQQTRFIVVSPTAAAAVDDSNSLSSAATGLLRQLVYCGALKLQLLLCLSLSLFLSSWIDDLQLPKLAIAGRIQLAEVPQFESFYTVPLFWGSHLVQPSFEVYFDICKKQASFLVSIFCHHSFLIFQLHQAQRQNEFLNM